MKKEEIARKGLEFTTSPKCPTLDEVCKTEKVFKCAMCGKAKTYQDLVVWKNTTIEELINDKCNCKDCLDKLWA